MLMSSFTQRWLLALGCLGVALAIVSVRFRSHEAEPTQPVPVVAGARISQELAQELAQLETRERAVAETAWAKELLAQDCARTFENFWDSLNAASNKFNLVRSFPIGQIVIPQWLPPTTLPHGIKLFSPSDIPQTKGPKEWLAFLDALTDQGWRLVQTEFRHVRFVTDEAGSPLQSEFDFLAHFDRPSTLERAALEGRLGVLWSNERRDDGTMAVRQIDARRLSLKTRQGETPFRCIFQDRVSPLENTYAIDPLIVHDLDGDGQAEIMLAGRNLLYRRRVDGSFQSEPLCQHPPGIIYSAVVADFSGDGFADLLCAKLEGLVLFRGSGKGPFTSAATLVWPAPPDLKFPMVLTAGDVDSDGDLDLFLGQYKVPYENGAMPTPYHDANDGNPAYLLHNDGQGRFSDATESSRLTSKRWRRSYSGSLADLDQDRDMDLAVVSDFAGLDLYRNDRTGRFEDVTSTWVPERQAFGMAHALADFNRDGRLDFLMIGMNSPTADRLEHLQLWRSDSSEDRTMRARMTHGNHLYLASERGGFITNDLSTDIARTGWSWGCSTPDIDNDGFPDIYIANGLESRESVRDYEAEYWLHDKHVGYSHEQSAAYLYFKAKFSRTRGRGQSYGGYEKNRLYLNREGTRFVEIAHLMGLALEEDSRNVVSEDIDGDGRLDLILTSYEPWPQSSQVIRVFRNELAQTGNWIGLRLAQKPGTPPPVGAQVTLLGEDFRAVRQWITGDSHRSQHPQSAHFGMGAATRVREIEVTWIGGASLRLPRPAINRYHLIDAPPRSQASP